MRTTDFKPEDNMLRMPNYILKDILDKGYAFITLPNGSIRKITEKDLYLKKDELDAFLKTKEGKKMLKQFKRNKKWVK